MRSAGLLVLTLLAAGATRAQPLDPPLLQALEWRSIGPFRGGRTLAATGVPGEPNHFYFGAVNGGIWESVDAGRTWNPVFDGESEGSIGALAVAPSDARVIYAGTGEADMRSDIAQGRGMFKSIDGGHHWRPIGLDDSRQIARIVVDELHADRLLVAALGHPYGPNEMRGVFRSVDGGATWARTLHTDADTGAVDLAATPGDPDIVYAALWQTRRPPWSVYPPSSGPGGGLYRSTDGGSTWTSLQGRGLPERPGRIGLAISAAEPRRVYALVDAAAGGLYRSDDAGGSWHRISQDARIWKRGWYFGGVTVDATNADLVYVCNTAVYRSTDGGRTFVPVKGAPGGDDYHQLWIDAQDPGRRILASDQGAVVSLDGGTTWSSWYNQPTGQFYHVATDRQYPYRVYGSQQDSGAASVPSRTDDIDGIGLAQFRKITAGGESDNVLPDRADPPALFGGRVQRLDPRTGQTHDLDPTLAYPDLYRSVWTLPLAWSRAGPQALFFANQRIFASSDRGRHWRPISPDLSRPHTQAPATLDAATRADDDHATRRKGVVYSLGPSPLDGRTLWAGTDDGLVWRTTDGGAHWRDVSPPAVGAWSKVSAIEPSNRDAATAYVAVDRHRLDDAAPYLYRTRDGGTTWTSITQGIGEAGAVNSVNVVREDPVRRGVLYCGTEHGVYVSIDDGDHWQSLQQNLPRTSVRDLTVQGADLVIATHGRGFWIMDDVAPLRAFAADAHVGTRLLPPAAALRVRPRGFAGTPRPKDEPAAANPPPGAVIDYVLDAALAEGPVTLTILDAGGAPVRSFRSTEAPQAPALDKIDIAPDWVTVAAPPATGAGAHRFVWDLKYAPPRALLSDPAAGEAPEQGVWAPPGTYWVELETPGGRSRRPLTLLPDPRVRLPAEAYRQEFALARRIEAARVAIATQMAAAAKLHEAILGALVGADAGEERMLRAADSRLVAMDLVPPAAASPDSTGRAPASTTGFRYLAAAFERLARAVDGADGAPGPDARRGYLAHRALLATALGAWSRFEAGDLLRNVRQRLGSKEAQAEPAGGKP